MTFGFDRKIFKGRGCTVVGCKRFHWALGLCRKHHARFKKYGDPLIKCRTSRCAPGKVLS